MRKLSFYIAAAFLFNACTYHDTPTLTWGSMKVLLNNEAWDGSRYPDGHQNISEGHYGPSQSCETEYYSVQSVLFNVDGFERESFFFELAAIPPGTKGRFEIRRTPNNGELPCVDEPLVTSAFYTIAQDGDVLQDVYDVLESEENYIEIHTFDPKTMEIKGIFQVTFIVTRRSSEPSSLPDTLRFSNGSFHTIIL